LCQKLLKSDIFKLSSNMSSVFFTLLYISTHILLDLLSLGSAEAGIG